MVETKMRAILWLLAFVVSHVFSAKLDAGTYMQWRVQVPYTDPEDLPSCYEHCTKSKCGPELKGVAVCGAMFEFKDEVDSKDPDKELFVHCFCQRSVTAHRTPGFYCGPNGEQCKTLPAAGNQPPPEGNWVDGVNTLMEKDNKQGMIHLNSFKDNVKGFCFEIFQEETKVIFEQARDLCKDRGYQLPEILSPAQHEAFKEAIVGIGSKPYLGLFNYGDNITKCAGTACLEEGNNWVWFYSNQPLSAYHLAMFSGFYADENVGCAVTSTAGTFVYDSKCNRRRSQYVCQKPCE